MNHRLDSPPMLCATMSTCRRRWAATNARIAPALTTLSWPGRAIAYTVRPSRTRRAAIVRKVVGDDSNPWTSRTGGSGAAFAGSGPVHSIAMPTSARSTLRRPVAHRCPRVTIGALSSTEVVNAAGGAPGGRRVVRMGHRHRDPASAILNRRHEAAEEDHAHRVHRLRGRLSGGGRNHARRRRAPDGRAEPRPHDRRRGRTADEPRRRPHRRGRRDRPRPRRPVRHRGDRPTGEPARRLHTVRHRLEVRLGPYTVLGQMHTRPGGRPLVAIGQGSRMVPLTNATIAFNTDHGVNVIDVGTLIINRSLADWVRADAGDMPELLGVPVAAPAPAI